MVEDAKPNNEQYRKCWVHTMVKKATTLSNALSLLASPSRETFRMHSSTSGTGSTFWALGVRPCNNRSWVRENPDEVSKWPLVLVAGSAADASSFLLEAFFLALSCSFPACVVALFFLFSCALFSASFHFCSFPPPHCLHVLRDPYLRTYHIPIPPQLHPSERGIEPSLHVEWLWNGTQCTMGRPEGNEWAKFSTERY